MDYLNILLAALDSLSGPSWLFKFGWSFLISQASDGLHVLIISKQLYMLLQLVQNAQWSICLNTALLVGVNVL